MDAPTTTEPVLDAVSRERLTGWWSAVCRHAKHIESLQRTAGLGLIFSIGLGVVGLSMTTAGAAVLGLIAMLGSGVLLAASGWLWSRVPVARRRARSSVPILTSEDRQQEVR